MAEAILVDDSRSATANVVAGGAVTTKTVFEGTGAVGVYLATGVSGDTIAVDFGGCWELDKETGVVFTVGDLLFWDATNDRLDKTITNIFAGIAAEAAATGATRAKVHLNLGSTLVA